MAGQYSKVVANASRTCYNTAQSEDAMVAYANVARAPGPARYWLQVGRQALKNGKRDEAVRALRQAVAADPYHTGSLLWLSGLCDDPRESLRLLSRVLALDPRNDVAHEGIRWARRRVQGARQRDEQSGAAQRAQPARTHPPARWPARLADRLYMSQQSYDWLVRFTRTTIVVCLILTCLLSAASVWLLLLPAPDGDDTLVAAASTDAVVEEPALLLEQPETRLPARPRAPSRAEVYEVRAAALMRAVDVTWAKEDWDQSAMLLAQAIAFRPGDPVLKRKLMAAYFNAAVNAIDDGELDRALTLFDQALQLAPNDPQVLAERETLANYLKGASLYGQRNWGAAAQVLRKVYASDAGYLDTRGLLYRAYYFQGIDLKENEDWLDALNAFQTALAIDGNGAEAKAELARTQTTIENLQPGALGEKWIDVNLSTQRFRALQGQNVVYSFVTSTGENGRETQPGRYQILDKIPNAYSRYFDLWMPYWMGIYWAGSSEDGIHALPILSSGQTLWGGYLGRRVSFGCVILETSAAKLIYDWADIGTTVVIHY